MALLDPLRRRMLLLVRSERGMALPTALFAMLASFALASAAVLSSVDAQQGTKRDHDSKEAIAAADAGASLALARLNQFHDYLSASHRCIGPAGEWLPESTEFPGWCPATPAETVGNATYSYRVSSSSGVGSLSVISVGASGTVSRRVEVGLISYAGEKVFAGESMIGQKSITVNGEDAKIYSDLGTNGDIEVGNGTPTICGNLRHGVGKEAPDPEAVCPGEGYEETEAEKPLPPIVPPEGIETSNSNCRLVPECLDAEGKIDTIQVDSYSKKRTKSKPWDKDSRTINLGGEATLTLGGQDYFICQLNIEGGAELIMPANAEVRIFFDTPEDCGLEAGTAQVHITGGGEVVSTGYNPPSSYDLLQLYVIGSPTVSSRVVLDGEGTNELIIYAPYSEIEIGGSEKLIGLAAGQSLTINGGPTIESNPNIKPPDQSYSTLWQRSHYVECSGGTASPPNASC